MNKAALLLDDLLRGCRAGDRNSQQKLYEHFYGYAMHLCLRYTKHREEAVEILNDAFFKALTKIDTYDPALPFKSWLRRILINTAIDHFRKKHPGAAFVALTEAHDVAAEALPMPRLAPDEDMLPILRELSPAYRMVFNLYVMEGYKHQEIAELLGITPAASRSNLTRALEKLRTLLADKEFGKNKLLKKEF